MKKQQIEFEQIVERGCGIDVHKKIIVDMDQFPDEKHLASWAGMSPGSNESAGKKKVVELHKILIAVYFILKDKVAYKELGYEYLQSLKKDKKITRHLKILKELGIEVEIKTQVA